ncbi:glycosyltransferase family 2 protein [Candidatus Beckwithbacteria bacterium]|nr:glycosyltransferase family 2 protein [Candidatus Beckwithbacteria bacterium]
MAKEKAKVVVIMPAYNAAKTLEKTVKDIPPGIASEIILVDDGSSDKTIKVAQKMGLSVFSHPANLGYGGNQKTCYWEALKKKPDIVVMIHPDYQYDATLTEELIRPIVQGRFDIMLGSRVRSRAEVLAGGMPWWKYYGNRFLTISENIFLGLNLSEYHTGFRAYSAKALRKIPFMRMSNNFVFDQQLLISAVANNLKIGEIPVPVRYFPEASSANFMASTRYGLETLFNLGRYMFNRQSRKFTS